MILLLSKVARWLRDSELYDSYDKEEESVIPVPDEYYCKKPLYNTW